MGKNLIGRTPFLLAYRKEAIMYMEYIVPRLIFVVINEMTYVDVVEDMLLQLV